MTGYAWILSIRVMKTWEPVTLPDGITVFYDFWMISLNKTLKLYKI